MFKRVITPGALHIRQIQERLGNQCRLFDHCERLSEAGHPYNAIDFSTLAQQVHHCPNEGNEFCKQGYTNYVTHYRIERLRVQL
jgi:hypothetical protein